MSINCHYCTFLYRWLAGVRLSHQNHLNLQPFYLVNWKRLCMLFRFCPPLDFPPRQLPLMVAAAARVVAAGVAVVGAVAVGVVEVRREPL